MSEIEKMYKLANVAKPVIKKWYYDGYYEDFSWQFSEEDCTELLKYFDNSIDKLNDRIQQMKKEENTKYDRYTDSVDTEFGRVEKAYIKYPPFTAEKQIELFKLLIRHPKTEIYCRYANSKYKLIMYTEDCCAYDMDSFGNVLASVVCDVWGLLSEKERKQIKEILNG